MESIVESATSSSHALARGKERRWYLAMPLLWAASYSPAVLAMDCADPMSAIDKAICADFSLSRLDVKLNNDYAEAMKRLSPRAQSAIRSDQRNWLRYRETACGFADPSAGDTQCLAQQYLRRDDRLLGFIAHQQGPAPYLFSVRGTYEAMPGHSGDLPFQAESSIPQIDQVSTRSSIAWADAQSWNDLIAKRIGGPERISVCPGGKGDVYKESHITIASVLLIGVTVNRSDECRGGSRGLAINWVRSDYFSTETQYNVVMMRGDVHELGPSDLFLPGDRWKELFSERLEQEVQKQSRGHGYDWHPSKEAMERVVRDPTNWMPGGDVFRIRINKAALSAPDFVGAFTVDIPWGDLQGMLSIKGQRILNAATW